LFRIILTISVFTVGCLVIKKNMMACDGCERCQYESFTKTVHISSFDLDKNDKPSRIHFSAEDHHQIGSLWIDKCKITEAKLDTLKLSSLKNSNIHFQITGKAIINGTCPPYVIKKIVYLK
jgi:hypothetical protein